MNNTPGAAYIYTSQLDSTKTQVIMGTAGEKNNFWRGLDFYLTGLNKLSFRLIHSLPHNYIEVTTTEAIPTNQWTHVAFTYDGSAKGSGITLYIDGERTASTIEFDNLYKSILPVRVTTHIFDDRPVRVGKSYRSYTGENGIYKGKIDEIRFYDRALSPLEITLLVDPNIKPSKEQITFYQLKQTTHYKNGIKELSKLRGPMVKAY